MIEWIDGEKLSQSSEDDMGALVNLRLTMYLTQLLEFVFYHSEFKRGGLLLHLRHSCSAECGMLRPLDTAYSTVITLRSDRYVVRIALCDFYDRSEESSMPPWRRTLSFWISFQRAPAWFPSCLR